MDTEDRVAIEQGATRAARAARVAWSRKDFLAILGIVLAIFLKAGADQREELRTEAAEHRDEVREIVNQRLDKVDQRLDDCTAGLEQCWRERLGIPAPSSPGPAQGAGPEAPGAPDGDRLPPAAPMEEEVETEPEPVVAAP